VKALQTSKHSVTVCHIPEDFELSAHVYVIALQLSERYFLHTHTHTDFEANILVTQFVYEVFQSTVFFAVTELGDEMTAVIFRQELPVGKGGKSMFQVVLLVNVWIVRACAM
jgi:predicted DNA repair protein MutK